MSEWGKLWGEEICSTAEIFMKAPAIGYAMTPWLEKVKAKGDKLQETIHLLRYLVEDYLPQIGMTIHFREMFYQIVGEPYPEWFEIPEPGFYELEWMEAVRGLATKVIKDE